MNIWAALDEDSKDQEDDGGEDEPELFLQGVLMVVMLMRVLVTFVVMMMFVRLMGLVIVMMVTFVVVIMMVMFVAPRATMFM